MGETIRLILFVSDLQSDIYDSSFSWGAAPSFDVSDFQSVEIPMILSLLLLPFRWYRINRKDAEPQRVLLAKRCNWWWLFVIWRRQVWVKVCWWRWIRVNWRKRRVSLYPTLLHGGLQSLFQNKWDRLIGLYVISKWIISDFNSLGVGDFAPQIAGVGPCEVPLTG